MCSLLSYWSYFKGGYPCYMLYHLLANIPILIYVSCYFYEIKGNVKITYTIVYSVSCVTLCFLVHSFKGGPGIILINILPLCITVSCVVY